MWLFKIPVISALGELVDMSKSIFRAASCVMISGERPRAFEEVVDMSKSVIFLV